jgi:hypothetical protein
MSDVENPQLDRVACSQFAVHGKVEQCKVASQEPRGEAEAEHGLPRCHVAVGVLSGLRAYLCSKAVDSCATGSTFS